MLAALALAGCAATATDLRIRQPIGVYQTTRPPAEIVRCLVREIQTGQPSVITDDTETTVTFSDRGAAVLVFAIASGAMRVWRLHSLTPHDRASRACA